MRLVLECEHGNISVDLPGRRIARLGSAANVAIAIFFSFDPCRFCPRISSICEVRGFRTGKRLGRHGGDGAYSRMPRLDRCKLYGWHRLHPLKAACPLRKLEQQSRQFSFLPFRSFCLRSKPDGPRQPSLTFAM